MPYQHPLRHKVKPIASNSQLGVTAFVHHELLQLHRLEFHDGHSDKDYALLTMGGDPTLGAERT